MESHRGTKFGLLGLSLPAIVRIAAQGARTLGEILLPARAQETPEKVGSALSPLILGP